MAYKVNIESETLKNTHYRKVLFTTPEMQLVLMSLEPQENIPREKHEKTSQFIRVESGKGIIMVGNRRYRLRDGDSIIIPHQTWHLVKNTGKRALKLYTIYSPPEHPKKIIHRRQPN
jgi:mannose-6-phosphate isomerase-like protein (cupin superfamily)